MDETNWRDLIGGEYWDESISGDPHDHEQDWVEEEDDDFYRYRRAA